MQLGRLSGQARILIRCKNFATPYFDFFPSLPMRLETLLKGTGWAVGEVVTGDDDGYVAVTDKLP